LHDGDVRSAVRLLPVGQPVHPARPLDLRCPRVGVLHPAERLRWQQRRS
jgi:hypothetical protein